MYIKKIFTVLIVTMLILSGCSNNDSNTVQVEKPEKENVKTETVQSAVEKQDIDYTDKAYEYGKILYDLKIFDGLSLTEYVPNLDGEMNREEAMKMIVSALGWEPVDPSKSPFTDVSDWAKPYVGSAYLKGIALGTVSGEKIFGAKDKVNMRQLLTFYLRALGYETTFAYENAFKLGELTGLSKGVIDNEEYLKRYHLILVTYNALSANKSDSPNTLVEDLVEEGRINRKDAVEAGVIKEYKYPEQRKDGAYLFKKSDLEKEINENQKCVIVYCENEKQWNGLKKEIDFAAVVLSDQAKVGRVYFDSKDEMIDGNKISLPAIKYYNNGVGSVLPNSIDGKALIGWVNSN